MRSIRGAEVERVAASVPPADACALVAAFRAQATSNDGDDPWRLLANVLDMHFRSGNPDEPFGPMVVMDGRRSMIPGDLNDGELTLLRQILDEVMIPAVRARVGDVLWVARRDSGAGREAVPAYLLLGATLEDPDMWPPCMECYERAVRLARSLGRNNPLLADALRHLASRVEHYQGEDASFFTSRALELLEEFRFGDPSQLGTLARKAADRRMGVNDPYSARSYYDVAARLLSRAGLTEGAEQARIASAQTWVAEADQAERANNYGGAQSHLESAIQAYRAIPGCKGLLPGLHHRLDAAGAEALKLMKPISSGTIDISPMVRAARQSVLGLSMAEAVYALACAAPFMDPIQLREQVLQAAEKTPLSSMFSSIIYDSAGRVVHKSPGLFTDNPDEREQAIEAQMSRHADMFRGLTVSAQISPALMALLGEHTLDEADIMALLQGSILVPEGRDGLFAMGLASGFRRDMVTAMHLLVPQLEHALRKLLRDVGTITASIDQDGIQSEWPLGRLLSAPEIHAVLPEALVFEMRSLLVYKGSSNIRNRLCHGLIEVDEFGTANVVYLWWLLLKVSLHGTPGFQAWVDERVRNGGNLDEQQTDC